VDRALSKIKFKLDRLRATSQHAKGEGLRYGRNRANRASEELRHRKRRAQQPLCYPVCRHRGAAKPSILRRNIDLDVGSSCGQLAYFVFRNCTLVYAHRVADRSRSQHHELGPTVVANDQPLVDRAGRRRTPPHRGQRRHVHPSTVNLSSIGARSRSAYAPNVAIGTLPNPRAGIARAVRERIAGDFEAQHAEIWREGERWFSEQDAIWRVHADTSMFIGGIRALLMQSLHPVALQAVADQAGFRRDFWGRFQRTSRYLAITTYGTVLDAERAIAVVRAIHRRVTGRTPDGRRYSAEDPHLLMWVHVAEVDSFLKAFQVFGAEKLSAAEADEYVRQMGSVAARLGLLEPPNTVAELMSIIDSYRPELSGSSQAAREASDLLLVHPPFAGVTRAAYHVLAASAVSIVPAWARRELRLPALPITERALIRPLGRSAMQTLRWALSE
jgi:uncharacterized protein (DUF2236 family)